MLCLVVLCDAMFGCFVRCYLWLYCAMLCLVKLCNAVVWAMFGFAVLWNAVLGIFMLCHVWLRCDNVFGCVALAMCGSAVLCYVWLCLCCCTFGCDVQCCV